MLLILELKYRQQYHHLHRARFETVQLCGLRSDSKLVRVVPRVSGFQ